ncbi:hypothetical protein BHE74_00004948, partial [Ensete ventricosum]
PSLLRLGFDHASPTLIDPPRIRSPPPRFPSPPAPILCIARTRSCVMDGHSGSFLSRVDFLARLVWVLVLDWE